MWSMQKYSSNKKCEDKMVGFTAQGPFCYVYQQTMLFLHVIVVYHQKLSIFRNEKKYVAASRRRSRRRDIS